MAECMARSGGLGILPQDMDIQTLLRIWTEVQASPLKYDTPIIVSKENTVRDALGIIYKRSHQCVILVDEIQRPIAIYKPKDFEELDQYAKIGSIKKTFLVTAPSTISSEEAFDIMDKNGISSLPITDINGVLLGVLTKKQSLRNDIYTPTVDHTGKLTLGIALGVNGYKEKFHALYDAGVRIFVLDTAHGYQTKMLEAIKYVHSVLGNQGILVAGNVITEEATKALIQAGANGVKVGIGPGAMCTTRMKTGVGRPQFTAVYKCSQAARSLGGFVWADG
jgi:IMP dehydrogenase